MQVVLENGHENLLRNPAELQKLIQNAQSVIARSKIDKYLHVATSFVTGAYKIGYYGILRARYAAIQSAMTREA